MDTTSGATRPDGWWLTRFVMLRLLGVIYAVAFLAAAKQLVALIGASGLLPSARFSTGRDMLGSRGRGFATARPSSGSTTPTSHCATVAWSGFAVSCVVARGVRQRGDDGAPVGALLLDRARGQDWYGYGWELQLIETGFLAIFLCPLLDPRPFPRRPPPVVVLWLFRWLSFRIMLGAGLIKLRGDPAWRDLTALYYHFETQPIPNPLSRSFHFPPRALLRAGVLMNHAAELVAPWLVLGPRVVRRIGGAVIVLFQTTLLLSGNLSFLNWLTIVPALACFDDALWARILPRALVLRAERAAQAAQPSRVMASASLALAALVAVLSVGPVLNMVSPNQIMNTSFMPLDLVFCQRPGLFGLGLHGDLRRGDPFPERLRRGCVRAHLRFGARHRLARDGWAPRIRRSAEWAGVVRRVGLSRLGAHHHPVVADALIAERAVRRLRGVVVLLGEQHAARDAAFARGEQRARDRRARKALRPRSGVRRPDAADLHAGRRRGVVGGVRDGLAAAFEHEVRRLARDGARSLRGTSPRARRPASAHGDAAWR